MTCGLDFLRPVIWGRRILDGAIELFLEPWGALRWGARPRRISFSVALADRVVTSKGIRKHCTLE
jgi:hypothetical protein